MPKDARIIVEPIDEAQATHDAWFRQGVDQGLATVDTAIPNEEVRALFAKKRAKWRDSVAAQ
jgi:hypothetical protein